MGFPVRAGDRQHPFVAQDIVADPLRPGHVGQSSIQDFFHQGITARHDIADHEQIRLQADLLRAEAFDQLDTLCLQLRAHRWIDVRIAAGDLVSGLFGQHRKPAHEGAADAENVDMHCAVSNR